MSAYRCVILGCGPRARWHARAYARLSRGALVACCDRHPERRERFEREFDVRTYADVQEMIRREQPDLIHLVTAPRTRVEQLALVHEAGIPGCIVEKPIAYQVADWRALVALEARTSTRIGVNAQVPGDYPQVGPSLGKGWF
jgi:predicted dehydrogenase